MSITLTACWSECLLICRKTEILDAAITSHFRLASGAVYSHMDGKITNLAGLWRSLWRSRDEADRLRGEVVILKSLTGDRGDELLSLIAATESGSGEGESSAGDLTVPRGE